MTAKKGPTPAQLKAQEKETKETLLFMAERGNAKAIKALGKMGVTVKVKGGKAKAK